MIGRLFLVLLASDVVAFVSIDHYDVCALEFKMFQCFIAFYTKEIKV